MVRVDLRLLFRRLREEDGQATIEFALVIPFLMFIVIALVSFGIAMNDAVDATHVANEGARLAAVDVDPSDYGAASIQDYIQEQAAAKDVKDADVVVCFPDGKTISTVQVGDPVRVIVGVDFNINAFIRQTFTLHGKSTMRLEQTPTASHYDPIPTACA